MTDTDDLILRTTLHAIDESMPVEKPRAHLGMSQIGKEDERSLWLKFRWSLPDEPEPRTKRIFSLGNAIEIEILDLLRRIPGITLYDRDPQTGDQFRFALLGGHFSGSMDFVVRGIPESKKWHVGECKSVSSKRFADLQKKGVKVWSPEYYGQLQCYMGASGMERSLFVAYNKDNSELYVERVKPEKMFFDAMIAKAERIITAPEPPATTWPNESWYESKYLPTEARAVYWGKRCPPTTNCRNCRFARACTQSGEWLCDRHTGPRTYADQLAGCPEHNWIPALVPAKLSEVHDDCVQYVTHDGETEFWNIPDGQGAFHHQAYSSAEISHLSKNGLTTENLTDAVLQQFRSELNATVIG